MFARDAFPIPGNTVLGITLQTRPAESLVSLAVRLRLANAFCLPFPVLVMLIFKIFLVQMVYVVIMAFATQKVSSSRGDARQGRGVVLPISSPKSYSSFFLY